MANLENKAEIKRLAEMFKKQKVSSFKMTPNVFNLYTIWAGDIWNSERVVVKKGLKKSLATLVLTKLRDGSFKPKKLI